MDTFEYAVMRLYLEAPETKDRILPQRKIIHYHLRHNRSRLPGR